MYLYVHSRTPNYLHALPAKSFQNEILFQTKINYNDRNVYTIQL